MTTYATICVINPSNPELNPIYLLALLGAHHFLLVSRIRVKSAPQLVRRSSNYALTVNVN